MSNFRQQTLAEMIADGTVHVVGIGLGITGLADCLAQMGLVYGSDEAVATTKAVMRKIANAAYFASSMLAKDRGSFPLFDDAHIELAEFFQKLDTEVQESIRENVFATAFS